MTIHTNEKTQAAYLSQVRENYTNYFQNITEVEFPSNKNRTVIDPSEIKIGDHIIHSGAGYVFKVTEIKVFNARPESKIQLPVYRVYGTYISGSLQNYKFMCVSTKCGCTKTHITCFQGNNNCVWTRIDK